VPGPVSRPSPDALKEACGARAPDLLGPGTRLLLRGINPSLWSGAVALHFANPGNRLWAVLHAATWTPLRLLPSETGALLAGGIGITNLVTRSTARADELTTTCRCQQRSPDGRGPTRGDDDRGAGRRAASSGDAHDGPGVLPFCRSGCGSSDPTLSAGQDRPRPRPGKWIGPSAGRRRPVSRGGDRRAGAPFGDTPFRWNCGRPPRRRVRPGRPRAGRTPRC